MRGSNACSIPGPDAALTATLRYLAPSGARHEAAECRLELGPGRRSATA